MPSRRRSSEGGFSLIEVLAAITVFGIITVGITPLIVSSIRGTSLSRSRTVARNLVSEAMERVRGLPFYETAAGRDFLDFYFPNLSTGYSAGVFTTTCTRTAQTPAGSGALACPVPHPDTTEPRIPQGYSLSFEASFVVATGTTSETFATVNPAATYNSAAEATSVPPSQLVRMTITASWDQLGEPRTFSLTSLIGDRKLSPDRARGTATVDYVFRVQTAYLNSDGTISGLTGLGARSAADVEIRSVASASIDSGGGSLVLSNEQSASTPGSILDSAYGAQASHRASPNTVPAVTTAVEDTIQHPGLLSQTIGFIDDTAVNEISPPSGVQRAGVSITDGLPKATTDAAFTGGVGDLFWATNQADTGSAAIKRFAPLSNMFTVSRPSGSDRVETSTYAEATATNPLSTRKVEATAHAELPRLSILPTTFASGGVIRIDNFVADVGCKSTGSSASGSVTGSWTATLRYWVDSDPSNNLALGGYINPALTISGNVTPTGSVDPLAAIEAANPLVYDGLSPLNDVYLFEKDGKSGYLESWASNFALTATKDDNTSRVSLPYAISIETAKTDSVNDETRFTVEVGKMSCQAVDNRD